MFLGVTAIYTKLGTQSKADTSNSVNARICDSGNTCCNIEPLSSSGDNIFGAVGKLSTIPGEKLGQCAKTKFKREDLKLTLTIDGNDGFKLDWVKLRLASGEIQTCRFNGWIDGDSGYSPSQTVTCQGIVIFFST